MLKRGWNKAENSKAVKIFWNEKSDKKRWSGEQACASANARWEERSGGGDEVVGKQKGEWWIANGLEWKAKASIPAFSNKNNSEYQRIYHKVI